MKVLVTGGAGFVGSHLAEYFAKNRGEFAVFDNLSRVEIRRKGVGIRLQLELPKEQLCPHLRAREVFASRADTVRGSLAWKMGSKAWKVARRHTWEIYAEE